jgi:hypothetical protein
MRAPRHLKKKTWHGWHASTNLGSLEGGFRLRPLGISVARTVDEVLVSPTLRDRRGRQGLAQVRVEGYGLDYGDPQVELWLDSLDDHVRDMRGQKVDRLVELGASNAEIWAQVPPIDVAVIHGLRQMGVDWVNGWNGIGEAPELHVLNPDVITILSVKEGRVRGGAWRELP